jgi:hypothetical protein
MDDGKNRSNELEKMQNLAKLIHSMQIVNDHVQSTFIIVFYLLLKIISIHSKIVIESALFTAIKTNKLNENSLIDFN